MKNLLMTTIAIFGLALISNAQVPNYVSENGLIGWWPFNGNANDASFNSYNLINSNSVLVQDRFGNSNSAYQMSNNSDKLYYQNFNSSLQNFTISVWCKLTGGFNYCTLNLFKIGPEISGLLGGFKAALDQNDGVCGSNNYQFVGFGSNESTAYSINQTSDYLTPFDVSQWKNYVFTKSADTSRLYIDGILIQTSINTPLNIYSSTPSLQIGNQDNNNSNLIGIRQIDDAGLWDRALTQEEISNLFNATNCSNNLTISPAANHLEAGSTANFSATTSDENPSYIWQSDFGQGFQTLNNYGNYTGVNSNSLSISNVQLSEHNQPIRVISTSGECMDTSNVATINIIDTCIVTINDTITTLISVTDTLVINTLITGLTTPNNSNTIKVFPNPAGNHITIDYGNFASMNGYTLKITNSIGQTVFTTPVNQQSSYVDLSTWGGNGIYFVQIIDTQNNTIENRKIVLQ